MLQEKLGRRIAGLRKSRRLTQARLAKILGYSVDFISLVERGVNAPTVAGLEKFADVFKVTVRDLFTFAKLPKAHLAALLNLKGNRTRKDQ